VNKECRKERKRNGGKKLIQIIPAKRIVLKRVPIDRLNIDQWFIDAFSLLIRQQLLDGSRRDITSHFAKLETIRSDGVPDIALSPIKMAVYGTPSIRNCHRLPDKSLCRQRNRFGCTHGFHRCFSLPFYEVYAIEPLLRRLSLLSLSMRSRVVARKCYKRAQLSIACGFSYSFIATYGRQALQHSKSAIGSLRQENIV